MTQKRYFALQKLVHVLCVRLISKLSGDDGVFGNLAFFGPDGVTFVYTETPLTVEQIDWINARGVDVVGFKMTCGQPAFFARATKPKAVYGR